MNQETSPRQIFVLAIACIIALVASVGVFILSLFDISNIYCSTIPFLLAFILCAIAMYYGKQRLNEQRIRDREHYGSEPVEENADDEEERPITIQFDIRLLFLTMVLVSLNFAGGFLIPDQHLYLYVIATSALLAVVAILLSHEKIAEHHGPVHGLAALTYVILFDRIVEIEYLHRSFPSIVFVAALFGGPIRYKLVSLWKAWRRKRTRRNQGE